MGKLNLPVIAILLSVTFWSACSDPRVAGGFDDVQNPALTLALQKTDGTASSDAELRVFARFQNPTIDTIPLLERMVQSGHTAVLTDSDLVQSMRAAVARGLVWPNGDTVEFNVQARNLASSDSALRGEAFVADFRLARSVGTVYQFSRSAGDLGTPSNLHLGNLAFTMTTKIPVPNFRGSVGTRGKELSLTSVFIPGSPYWCSVDTAGNFVFPRLAQGRFAVKSMSRDGKAYGAADSLNTSAAYTATDWSEANILWIKP